MFVVKVVLISSILAFVSPLPAFTKSKDDWDKEMFSIESANFLKIHFISLPTP